MITGQIAHFRLQDAVIAALEEAVREQMDILASGVASDWSDYKMRLGIITGLRTAIDVAQATEKTFREG